MVVKRTLNERFTKKSDCRVIDYKKVYETEKSMIRKINTNEAIRTKSLELAARH